MMRSSVFVLLALLSVGTASAVTPVEKVITLLANLEVKVTEEGKEEAAQYDKFACFCKEQADEKTYSIEKSEKKITELSALIADLKAEINTLNSDISKLSKVISDLSTKISKAEAKRETEHATYEEKEADAAGAISAAERAIEALKGSKGDLEGHVDDESFVQVRTIAVLAMATKVDMTEAQWKMLNKLAQPNSGEAAQYEYHSNDIIATIESLLAKFTKIKSDLDQEEFETNSAFEKERLGMQNEKKFATQEKNEKEALMEKKTEEKEAAEEENTKENADMTSDMNFRDELTKECENKAMVFDQRSKTRSGELTAISEAMTALKTGVAPNYAANKKLNGLVQRNATVAKAAVQPVAAKKEDKKAAKVVSFLQLRGSHNHLSDSDKAVKMHAFLQQASDKLSSPTLSALALKVLSQQDHFVKVRGIIKDLLARLEEDAAAEATQKGFCDKSMTKAITRRDEEQSGIESKNAEINSLTAKIQELTEEVATLSKQISENKKALNEATELREEEKAENEKTLAESDVGKTAVEQAITVLKGFYEGAALVQYTPPNADRSGKTVSDLAPAFANEEYSGSQDSSKGIVGMLEVILSDFDRTIKQVTDDEESAQSEFESFKETNEADTATKEASVEKKNGLIKQAEEDKVTAKDALDAHMSAHAAALGELEKLHTMCVAGEETYAERVAKRNKEIEALKEAQNILENWQN